jgi:type III secretion system low calcium response chaperone LcrH/SycD
MKSEQEQIKKATEQLGAGIKADEEKDLQTALKRITRKGSSARDVLGLTDAMIEGIYGQAYRLYNTGKFRDANQLFRLLIMINPTEPKYVMGLAACFHMIKEYKSAVDTYAIVGVVDPKSPVPLYHASDCYMQMGDPVSALISLEMAVRRAGDRPEFKTLKERALLTVESLKREVSKAAKAAGKAAA